ncbi:MAG: hypothetical protein RIB67_10350 [Miltoncostaeaceae bacterium]
MIPPGAGPAAGGIAVVDVGSNSLRLLCCEGMGTDGPVGVRGTTVVGLRRGAAEDGTLSEESLARLEEAVMADAERVRAFAPDRVVAACTSATRDAPNGQRVVAMLQRHLGASVHVLAGEAEAELAFAGAALAVPDEDPVMVVDVGGGSTELVRGAAGVLAASVSMQLGAVRQTDAHIAGDPPAAAELAAVRADARAQVRAGLRHIGGPARPVAVAGTATTLAAIDLGRYDPALVHGHTLALARVSALVELLAGMTLGQRRELPGLEPARAGVIVAGAAIIESVLVEAGEDGVTISERDILDGLALAALGLLGDTFHIR